MKSLQYTYIIYNSNIICKINGQNANKIIQKKYIWYLIDNL